MIRKGTKADLPAIHDLIMELAIYEKEPDAVEVGLKELEENGFGENAIFNFFVAEDQGEIIGTALYYYRYSTWKGRAIYLEDLIVTQSYRGKGFGKKLLDAIVSAAKKEGCTQVRWQVLDWNESAIKFYESLGADIDKGWYNCTLDKAQIDAYND